MQSSPVLEIELHKTFELYPDILAQVFIESKLLAVDEANSFEVYYSAFKNRLLLPSGMPDMIVGSRGKKKQYLVEIKTVSKLIVEQIVRYHQDILDLLRQNEYPHLVEKIIPVFVLPKVAPREKEELAKREINCIELDYLTYWNIENILRERDRRIWTMGKVRKDIRTLAFHRATYILPLLDYLHDRYTSGSITVTRDDLLGVRPQIMVSGPDKEPTVRPAFARINELLRVSELLGLIEMHKQGSTIASVNLTEMGRAVAKEGKERSQKIVFSQSQLRYIVPAIMDDPFKNFLINGIFLMIETVIELGEDSKYTHIGDVFAHKVGICQKSSKTIESIARFYLNYCEDLGLLILLPNIISPTELGRLAYRVMRTNEVEAIAKTETLTYLKL